MYLKYTKVLNQTYRDENIIQNLSKTLGVEIKQDWVGRLYCIFNPNLIGGKFDPNNPIYSYDDNGMNTDDFVRTYLMTKLDLANRFIRAQNLFDLLTYDLKKLDNYDNYCFILKPIPYDDCIKWSKRFLILLLFILISIVTLLLIF